MAHDPVAFSIDNGVARISFDDPDKRNAVSARTAVAFARCAREAASDDGVRVILVRGVGRFFSPGGDIEGFLAEESRLAQHLAVLTDGIHAGVRYLAQARAPVIIGLNGMAAGGGVGIALSGDYVIACQSARLNCAYTRSGLTPDAGTTWFLARRLTHAKAFELAALNDTITAEEARGLGLVNRVVPDEEFDAALEDAVARFLAMPEGVLGETKLLLRGALDSSLETHLEAEAKAIIGRARLASTVGLLKSFLKRRPYTP
jgi:2-(1,2-epoxy-1,2-dihydrophenyl)acetyl-CoA isomerase